MDLEEIETLTLNYLSQTSSPLVGVNVLFAHLKDRGLPDDFQPSDLLDFLSNHADVKILRPNAMIEAGPEPSGANATSGVFALLVSRRPTETQLAAMMLEQLDALEDALKIAREHSAEAGDEARREQIEDALKRTLSLRDRLAPYSDAADTDDTDERPPDNILQFPGLN